jgi:hypothetical protein
MIVDRSFSRGKRTITRKADCRGACVTVIEPEFSPSSITRL